MHTLPSTSKRPDQSDLSGNQTPLPVLAMLDETECGGTLPPTTASTSATFGAQAHAKALFAGRASTEQAAQATRYRVRTAYRKGWRDRAIAGIYTHAIAFLLGCTLVAAAMGGGAHLASTQTAQASSHEAR